VPERFAQPPAGEPAREHLHLYLVFDLSGSMTGTPLAEARKAAHRLAEGLDLSATSVGIIEFSERVQTTLKASQSAKEIARGIDTLTIGRTGMGTTAIPFDEVYNRLWNARGLRCALVLTDGAWANQKLAVEQARRCHKAEIDVIAVGFGRADEKFLREISSSDQYSFFTNLERLGDVFSAIAQELTEGGGQLDPERMKARRQGLALR
jgi:von Willebrand factor type A domain.